jgi:diazepam-binding inhibitor (GABA receptor modulator, acyl-CoA-binding protein)
LNEGIDPMSDLQAQFNAAAQAATNLSARPDNETMLKLYALFKQANDGDAGGSRPSMFDIVGRVKYDAWAGLKGMSKEAAMQGYIHLVDSLK